jgi:hypothetical protein
MALSSMPAVPHAADPRRAASPAEQKQRSETALRRVVRRRRARLGDAAATRDPFLDVVVIMSVLMFIALVVGLGILVLSTSVNWLN